jgi:flavin reductase (DIM6/NTAB) family NADH-FMN oxidoreductase RutF
MIVDYKDKELTQKYQLMANTIIPRPIAWIVTKSKEGVINVAPFSYFIGLSSNPATMLVSIGHKKNSEPKDTLKNLRETKVCTICMVDEKNLEKMHFSSKELDKNISEADEFDIELKEMVNGFPPMVSSTPSAFFCKYNQEITLEDSKTIPVVVEILHQYINDNIITDKENLSFEFEPIARVGKTYAALGKKITLPKID